MVKNTWPAPAQPSDVTPWEYLDAWRLSDRPAELRELGWIQGADQDWIQFEKESAMTAFVLRFS